MAVRIVDISITTDLSWQEVKNQTDRNAVKNSNADWNQLTQTTLVGQQVFISVEVVENDWANVKQEFSSWQEIKNKFTSWLGFKNQ